ncbi:hypothetical protein ACFWDF_24235 [Streptomyces diastaticus]|uniref:hypothetical protein n=1 Tax=Streptomyces diastaticus TaxID=1956 RepID=UPI00368B9DA0
MSADIVPKAQAIAAARAVLDRARHRRDRDRAAGRLPAEHELICRRLEREQNRREQNRREQTAHQAAA